MALFVGHDLGTGGDKAVLVDDRGRLLGSAFEPYPIEHLQPGWAEQDPRDFWEAVGATTRRVLDEAGAGPGDVRAVGFAAQMLTMVPVDRWGEPTRPAISWLDSRAEVEARRLVRRLGGPRVVAALAGAVPSGKDVLCKLAWLRAHEPDVVARTAAFCDATGFLVARATGALVADDTAAGATGLLDRRTRTWDRRLALATRTPLRGLPPVRSCADVVGGLRPAAARDLGLRAGTPVVAGMGDVPAALVGSGAVRPGDVHVCLGTSGWVCVTTPTGRDLARHGVFALPAPQPGLFALVGEMETAGECLDWIATRLAEGDDHARIGALLDEAGSVPAGSDGLLFLPWLYGERSPVTDTTLRGGFLNLSLEHTRAHLVRAVLEGVACNLRWTLEVLAAAGHTGTTLRVIGGGARSDLWLQVLADATRRTVEVPAHPFAAGAMGAALTAAVGVGAVADYAAIADLVPAVRSIAPRSTGATTLDRTYAALRAAHPGAARVSRLLAGPTRAPADR
ncbi:MAG: FGGY-family carbohydrate kinase [Acidimicrobiales bacterium]|nr:FGGY-family carbohydrate kinase [Acidimicrobiales bacterium]